jgi:excisionase family DNA binding protein
MTEHTRLPPVLTPKMLADYWLCSERHVRNLIKSGRLKSLRLGEKLIRIRAEDVEEFERRHAEPTWHDEPLKQAASGPTDQHAERKKPAGRLDRNQLVRARIKNLRDGGR